MNDLQLKRELIVHGIDLVGAETLDEKAIQFQRALKMTDLSKIPQTERNNLILIYGGRE